MDDDRAAGRARGLRARRRVLNLPFTDATEVPASSWLEPVIGATEHGASHVAGVVQFALAVVRPCVVRSSASSSPTCVYLQHKLAKAGRARGRSPHGWYYDEAVAGFMGGPGRRGVRRRRAEFDRTSSTARSTASAHARARARRRSCALGRPATCATTRSASPSAPSSCSASSSRQGVLMSDRDARTRRCSPPLDRRCPFVGAVVVGAAAAAPARAARAGRAARSRCSAGALSIAVLARVRDAADAGFQFVVHHTWIAESRHLAGTSASTASRCSSSCSPGSCSRSPSSAPIPTTTRSRTTRWMLAARGRLPRRVPGARPVPVLRLLRDRARADVLPDRAVGPRRTGRTPPSSSSCSRCSARRSCSSAIIATASCTSRRAGGPLTFDLVDDRRRTRHRATTTARWLFLGFAIAFAVKVPLFPLHTWLPDAHTEAPTAGSVILAGVMLKLGTYGFLRFGLYLFPEASHCFAPVMLTLGVIGIIYGAIVRHDAEGPQAARRLLVGRPPRLHRARHRSRSPRRASRAACCR